MGAEFLKDYFVILCESQPSRYSKFFTRYSMLMFPMTELYGIKTYFQGLPLLQVVNSIACVQYWWIVYHFSIQWLFNRPSYITLSGLIWVPVFILSFIKFINSQKTCPTRKHLPVLPGVFPCLWCSCCNRCRMCRGVFAMIEFPGRILLSCRKVLVSHKSDTG